MMTKEKILLESMKLFSVQGFDSVSIRTIAAAVGVTNSALYKHFSSKQAIFDALVENSKKRLLEKYCELDVMNTKVESLKDMCLRMFTFQTEDEWVTMFRRMLVIEQFKNPLMATTYREFFIDMPVQGQAKIFAIMIQAGHIKDKNPEVMAMELYAPFFLYHTIEVDKAKLEPLFCQHIDNFLEMYIKK